MIAKAAARRTPLRNERMGETLLPKRLALPVFCSDPLSSNAYATEEMLRALSLGGLASFVLTPWVGLGVAVLLAVVVISYRQTCHAYPSGGGAYAVSRENLGRTSSLVAASALLVDYALTVAVSVAARVEAITSAFLVLRPPTVAMHPRPADAIDAPYRDITGPVLQNVAQVRTHNPRTLVVVSIPEYVVGRF
jgi:amino acid transporter